MLASKTSLKRHSSLPLTIVTVVLIVLAGLIWLNRQSIRDHIAVWQYHPSIEVVSLSSRSGLSQYGQFLLYASQPSIESATVFNSHCGKTEVSTSILGCYSGNKIYVYNVTNSQLDGIQEVTAAHEMLHAAYARLSDTERVRVNSLLETVYRTLSSDKEYADRMAFYARAEPGERDNELHSIVGTEVAGLSPALELYYSQYFSDRSRVVALHTKYAQVFSSVETEAAQLSSQLSSLSANITAQSAAYNQAVSSLSDAISSFNTRARNGSFSSQAQFNAERAALVNQADAVSQTRSSINQQVDQYNMLRTKLQALAVRSDELNRSINSSLAPAPTL